MGWLLVFVGPSGLAGFVAARRLNRLSLSNRERESLALGRDRDDFDEWISKIELPPESLDRPEATATSLAALVDFAIDTDNSVIEDPHSGTYHVLHDGCRYTYRPPDAPDKTLPLDPLSNDN